MSSLAKFIAAAVVGVAICPFVAAAGNVTVKELTGGCSVYPDYDASAGQAGPWSIQVKNTGGIIDDHGLTAIYSRGSTGIRWGYMAALDKAAVAQIPLQCVDGQGIQARVPTGVSDYNWENLVAAEIPYDALLMYFVNGTEIKPYSHYTTNGTQIDGVFLGSEGYTTWAFQKDTTSDQGTFWAARLLGANSEDPSTGKPLFDGEITGFLRVYGS
ncbi:hypothetical protein CORC01_03926 [Colletotrichum orchidophilum]|uniref:Uncharacterized protein n=1 Tax=Colletotrichum orchidophilum TaxID=1209926 RepID=A0A1G4BHG7_9PEZI|nr:uncharacterized protein CORC01_03926 [Colletotrichum orchidophilum]OHF00852.1 hypothetical protein CORC01_03926 [Colletotrichum orchidophilum]